MPDRPVTYPVRGISASLERDFRWVGLGVGVITGEWIPAYDMPVPEGSGLDQLLPGQPAVCEQNPSAGEEVRRGTTVHVEVSRSC